MVSIQRGLLPELISPAADLFVTALGEKLIPVLGNEAKATAFIKSSIVSNSCLSAVENGRLLGVLAMQTNKQGFLVSSQASNVVKLRGDLAFPQGADESA